MSSRLRAALPHLRAGFVAFHLLAMLLLAFPAPVGGLDRSAWKDPTVQVELNSWAARLGIAEPRFEERLYGLATGYMGVRERVLRPFLRYVDVTGTDQPWRMFIAPHRFPSRFQLQMRVEGQPLGEFATIFEERSAAQRWHEDYFTQERVRSELFRFGWPEYRGEAQRHCDWLAAQVFEEMPAATAVRCRFLKSASPSAEDVLAGREAAVSIVNERVAARRPAGPR